MNSAIHGVRRIAHEFNMDMQWLGRTLHIGKSRVHEILTSAGIYEKDEIVDLNTTIDHTLHLDIEVLLKL